MISVLDVLTIFVSGFIAAKVCDYVHGLQSCLLCETGQFGASEVSDQPKIDREGEYSDNAG